MEQKKNNEQKADAKFVSQPIAKPHVVRSPNVLSSQWNLMYDFSFRELSNDAIITEGKCFIKKRSV